jgi:hypothetical protein
LQTSIKFQSAVFVKPKLSVVLIFLWYEKIDIFYFQYSVNKLALG